MEYNKFTVESIQVTRSGSYAQYTSEQGYTTLTSDFGFKVGDVVEWWGYDGFAPVKMNVNGKNVWNEEDRVKWWEDYNNKVEQLRADIRSKYNH